MMKAPARKDSLDVTRPWTRAAARCCDRELGAGAEVWRVRTRSGLCADCGRDRADSLDLLVCGSPTARPCAGGCGRFVVDPYFRRTRYAYCSPRCVGLAAAKRRREQRREARGEARGCESCGESFEPARTDARFLLERLPPEGIPGSEGVVVTELARIPHVTYGPTGLELAPSMDFNQWAELGALIGRIRASLPWWAGDWLLDRASARPEL